MKKNNLKNASAQAEPPINEHPFLAHVREKLRLVAGQILAEEVSKLCGPSHYPQPEAVYRRAGSENGVCYAEGRKEKVLRPRVRRRGADGKEREHELAGYQAMSDPANNAMHVVKSMMAGMTTRSQEWAGEEATSKSSACRHWIEATGAKIAELRERDLKATPFFGLMLDGVSLGAGGMVVVALGLAVDGSKHVRDFEPGASENTAVTKALVARLQTRGFGPLAGHRLLAVLDGSAPLHTAVLAAWPDALIQRCVVHKERNLYGYLRNGDHAEAARLWRRLRLAQGDAAGREALAQLRAFVAARNAAAVASLDEAGDQLVTLHTLDVPSTLHVSLLSTNAIENVMRNYRSQTAKVSRWDPATNQISRWTATALLQVERGFNRIKGHDQIPKLLQALALPSLTSGGGGASPSTPPRAL